MDESPAVATLPASELEFRFAAGLPVLDFMATKGERWRRDFERLTDPERFRAWLLRAGLANADCRVTEAELDDARLLRESIYRCLKLSLANQPFSSTDLDLINAWAKQAGVAPRLAADGSLKFAAVNDAVRRGLAQLAIDAVRLLTDPQTMQRVRECAAPDCALIFYDSSRPGKRKWCSDGACGTRNRARARRQKSRIPDRTCPERAS